MVMSCKRLWAKQPKGPEAETELGRQCQKQGRMSGPVADYYVQHNAERALESYRPGQDRKPN